MCCSSQSAMLSSRAGEKSTSSAITSPRWRDAMCGAPARGKMPSSGTGRAAQASRSRAAWAGPPACVQTMPAKRGGGSVSPSAPRGQCCKNPSATAAADCAMPRTSISSNTGSSSTRATSALEPAPLPAPSCSPMTPSIITASGASARQASRMRGRAVSPPIQVSRLQEGRPVTRAWWVGSMKSGPALPACTRRPRRRSAASKAKVVTVFPAPLCVAAMSRPAGACALPAAASACAAAAAARTSAAHMAVLCARERRRGGRLPVQDVMRAYCSARSRRDSRKTSTSSGRLWMFSSGQPP